MVLQNFITQVIPFPLLCRLSAVASATSWACETTSKTFYENVVPSDISDVDVVRYFAADSVINVLVQAAVKTEDAQDEGDALCQSDGCP